MRTLYTLLLAGALSATADCGTATAQSLSATPLTGYRAKATLPHAPKSAAAALDAPSHKKAAASAKAHATAAKAHATAAKAHATAHTLDVVTKQPDGTLRDSYYRSGESFVDVMGSILALQVDGLWGQVVEGTDGKTVWVHNPLNAYYADTWVKMERAEGDTLTMSLPMHFVHEEYSDGYAQDGYLYKLKATREEYEGSTYLTFIPDDDQTAKFVWRNDTLSFVNTTADSKLLGMCDEEGNWYGYGDYVLSYAPFAETPVAPKDASKAATYGLRYVESGQEYGRLAKVVREGDDIFVSGLSDNLPDAWAKGTLDGTKLTFKANQYMGLDKVTESYAYFQPIEHKDVWYDFGDGTGDYYSDPFLAETIDFTFDAAAGTFSTDSTFCVNQGRNAVNQLFSYEEAKFSPWEDKPYTPADPTDLSFMPYTEDLGYGIFSFAPYEFSKDDEQLDPAALYYNIFLDDEKFTFYPDEYSSLSEEMTDVPFGFTDRADFTNYAGLYNVYLYVTGFERIGVQMVYKGGGETHKSAIVYCDATDGIERVTSHGAAVSRTYTDLSGRRVAAPAKGVYVETVTYADGTRQSVKRVSK